MTTVPAGILAAAAGAVPLSIKGSGVGGVNTTDGQTGSISDSITVPADTTALIWAAAVSHGGTESADGYDTVAYNGVALTEKIVMQTSGATRPAWNVWVLKNPAIGTLNLTANREGNMNACWRAWVAVGGDVDDAVCGTPAVGAPNATNVDPRTIALTTTRANSIVIAGSVSQGADTDPMTATNDLGEILQTGDSGGGSATADVGAAIGWADTPTTGAKTFGFDAASSDGGQAFALEILPPA